MKKRAQKFAEAPPFTIPMYHCQIGAFLYDWLVVDEKPIDVSWCAPIDQAMELLRDKMVAILNRLAKGIYAPLLSSATNEYGWIDPEILLYRYKNYIDNDIDPDLTDMVLALLRVSRVDLRHCLDSSDVDEKADFVQALNYIAGGNSNLQDKSKKLFCTASFLKEINPRAKFDLGSGTIITSGDEYQTARWLYSSMPNLREAVCRANISQAVRCIDYMDDSDQRLAASLELSMESEVPLEGNAYLLISMGLIIGDPKCSGIAREAVIIAIEESRLDLERQSKGIRDFLHSPRSKPQRLAKSLKEIALVGPVHANAVRCLIEFVLTGDGGTAPRGLSHVLELYFELITEEGVALECTLTREYLESVKVGGKTGKLVKQILAK